jgi:hypothetical protein
MKLLRRLGAWVAILACAHLVIVTAMPRTSFAQQPKPAPKPGAEKDLIAKGRELFEDQQYEESIQTLSAALVRPTNTKEQKVEIYRLLALNYITLGRKDEADNAVRGLLVVNPEYALPPTESPRFRDFFAKAKERWEAEGRPGLVKETPNAKPTVLKLAAPSQAEPGQTIELRGKVEDPDGKATAVKLYYRSGTKGDFTEVDATLDGQSVRASIPGSAVNPPLVDYYFEVVDAQGNVLTSRGDSQGPLRVAVSEPSKGWVLPLAIGGGILGAAAIVGGLALAGVFKSSSSTQNPRGTGTVTINVGESAIRF